MERRAFLLGMGGLVFSACTSTTRLEPAPNPYAQASAGCAPPTPAAPTFVPRPLTPTPAPCAIGGVHYRVQPGDTLASIGRQSGSTVDAIRQANRLTGDQLQAGRLLWLPGGRPIDVVCAPGPTGEMVCEPLPTSPAERRGGYRVVARADWGARPMRPNHDPMNGIRRITLHHTDEVQGIRARTDREVVAAIQRYHQEQQGWADIGYHYLIGRDGLVFEGRPASAQGAHAGGANNVQNLGIAMIGNFTGQLPSHAQMNALEAFLADQRAAHRIAAGAVFGHRDLGPTECPGTTLYQWLGRYKTASV